ncbi:MAG: NosD domain-containing protein [Candidatus Thorarchaeota archaeon]
MSRRSLSLIFILIIMVLSFSSASKSVSGSSISVDNQTLAAQRVDHGPILIQNNTDFLAQKIVNGWSGDGSGSFPIRIPDYRIEGYQVGIEIANVDLSFLISNCETSNYELTYLDSVGIRIRNCTMGVITHSYAHMKEIGLSIEDSYNITIAETTTNDCHTGISVSNSTYVFIESNNLGWNDSTGIVLNQTERCWIYDNSLIALPDYGILCTRTNFTTIAENNITSTYLGDDQFSHYGLASYSSWYLIIESTEIAFCKVGIDLINNGHSYVAFCNIVGNTEFGIMLHSSSYNITLNSNYLGFNGINAYDTGSNNYWDSNYWSDYTGQGYYNIPGGQSVDLNPRLFPGETIEDPPPTTTAQNGDYLRLVLSFGIGFEIIIILYLVNRRRKNS